jgi:protocatechuate 3,4-dioxygenase beta subunit
MEFASRTPRVGAWALLGLVLASEVTLAGCRRPRKPSPPARPDATSAAPQAALRGRAVDQANRPLPDARVVALGAGETRTDPDGGFTVPGLSPGPYRLLVEAAGFAPFETAAVTAPAADVVIRLPGTALSVSGRVEVAGTGVAGVTVRLAAEEGGPIRETTTRPDGAFGFGGLGPGRYVVAATEGTRAAPPLVTSVSEPSGERLVLTLAPGATCAGLVQDDAGKPLAGRMVRVERAALAPGEDPLPGLAETDAQGRFRTAALPPGSYRVSAVATGYLQPSPPTVALTAAGVSPAVTVKLVRGGALAGRVVDPRGGAAAGAQLRCVASGLEDLSVQLGPLPMAAEAAALPSGSGRALGAARFVRADREGRFSIPGLIPGRYHLDVAYPGAEPLRSDELLVAPGEQRNVGTLSLRAGIALAGRVVDEGGYPIEGARVSIDPTGVPEGTSGQTTLTDGGGRWSLALRAGSYRISARAAGRGVAEVVATVGSTAPGAIELRLVRAEARLEGMVKDDGGRPLARARIAVRSVGSDATIGNAVTDAGGHFTVPGLPAGDVRLEIAHPDYPTTTQAATTGTFALLTVPFPGAVAGEVRVRITGAPVGRGRIDAIGPGGAETRAELGRGGSFRLKRLLPGRWRLTVTAPGFRQGVAEVDVPASVTLGDASVSNLRVEIEPG